MKSIQLIVLILSITLSSCAQLPKTPEAWLEQNTFELESNESYDFTEIGKAIGDKRIVALGESSHGIGKFYELKANLVKYLYEEKGFEVIAMEGGVGDINLAYSNIDTLSFSQLRDNTVFGNFRAVEVTPMFELIKSVSDSEKPLIYTGYDTQASSGYAQKTLMQIIKPYNKMLSDSLYRRFWSYGKSYTASKAQDSVGYIKHRDIFMNTSDEVSEVLKKNSIEIKKNFNLSDFQFQVLQRTLLMYKKSVDLSYENRWDGSALRDKYMYENLKWIMKELYPDKKIIIWAHNAHIENSNIENSSIAWMGHFLKKEYKDNYYALGLFAFKGNTYQHWTKKTVSFHNDDSTNIEKKLADTGKKVVFLDLENLEQTRNSKWLFENANAYEVENMGKISFTPTKRFDGIISVYESDIPTYDE